MSAYPSKEHFIEGVIKDLDTLGHEIRKKPDEEVSIEFIYGDDLLSPMARGRLIWRPEVKFHQVIVHKL